MHTITGEVILIGLSILAVIFTVGVGVCAFTKRGIVAGPDLVAREEYRRTREANRPKVIRQQFQVTDERAHRTSRTVIDLN